MFCQFVEDMVSDRCKAFVEKNNNGERPRDEQLCHNMSLERSPISLYNILLFHKRNVVL